MTVLLRPWRHYADFSGRSRRTEYFLFFICWYGAVFLAAIVGAVLFGSDPAGVDPEEAQMDVVPAAIAGIILLGGFLPSLAVTVRRLHDQGKSGWLILLVLIPYIGGLIMLVMAFIPGTDGENEYGADPRDPMQATADVFR